MPKGWDQGDGRDELTGPVGGGVVGCGAGVGMSPFRLVQMAVINGFLVPKPQRSRKSSVSTDQTMLPARPIDLM